MELCSGAVNMSMESFILVYPVLVLEKIIAGQEKMDKT